MKKLNTWVYIGIFLALSANSSETGERWLENTSKLEALSLKELMHVPLNVDYSKHQIYRSDSRNVDKASVNYGVIVPISEFPVYSAEVVAAADMAANYINQNGGINGKHLAFLRADDQENTPVSAMLAARLINEFNVKAFIGPATSDSVSDVLRKVAVPHNIPLISQAASTMALTEIGGDHAFWRMVANNNQQVRFMLDFLHRQQGHKQVYIISGRELYSSEIRQGITDYYENLKDGSSDYLAISNLVQIDSMNMKEEIEAIQNSGAEALVITVQNAQVIPMINKIVKYWQGAFPLIVLGDNVTPKYLVDADLGAVSECIFTYVASPKSLSPELRNKIIQELDIDTARFDAAYVYDATIILAMAQTLSEQYKLSIKQAVQLITSDGHPIDYRDFSTISKLYQQYRSFRYNGYSGRVHFSETGDNLAAFMNIYPIATSAQKPHCLQPVAEKSNKK